MSTFIDINFTGVESKKKTSPNHYNSDFYYYIRLSRRNSRRYPRLLSSENGIARKSRQVATTQATSLFGIVHPSSIARHCMPNLILPYEFEPIGSMSISRDIMPTCAPDINTLSSKNSVPIIDTNNHLGM
jgi:hypothetical protein